jgi:hypothetical protein
MRRGGLETGAQITKLTVFSTQLKMNNVVFCTGSFGTPKWRLSPALISSPLLAAEPLGHPRIPTPCIHSS